MDVRGRPLVDQVLRTLGPIYLFDEEFEPGQFDLNQKLRETHIDFWTAAFFTMNVVTDQTEWTKKVVEVCYTMLSLNVVVEFMNYGRRADSTGVHGLNGDGVGAVMVCVILKLFVVMA